MKKIMTMVTAIMMVVSANASNKSIETTIGTPQRVAPFTSVNVNVPGRIKVVQGEEYSVNISTTVAYDTTKLDYEVRDEVLYISTDCADMITASGRGTVITITTPTAFKDIKLGDDVERFHRKR